MLPEKNRNTQKFNSKSIVITKYGVRPALEGQQTARRCTNEIYVASGIDAIVNEYNILECKCHYLRPYLCI
jgi:hypothetical protein